MDTKIGKWSTEEHQSFLEAYLVFGHRWKDIQQHIGTRSCLQIRCHWQKQFKKIANKAKKYEKIAHNKYELLVYLFLELFRIQDTNKVLSLANNHKISLFNRRTEVIDELSKEFNKKKGIKSDCLSMKLESISNDKKPILDALMKFNSDESPDQSQKDDNEEEEEDEVEITPMKEIPESYYKSIKENQNHQMRIDYAEDVGSSICNQNGRNSTVNELDLYNQSSSNSKGVFIIQKIKQLDSQSKTCKSFSFSQEKCEQKIKDFQSNSMNQVSNNVLSNFSPENLDPGMLFSMNSKFICEIKSEMQIIEDTYNKSRKNGRRKQKLASPVDSSQLEKVSDYSVNLKAEEAKKNNTSYNQRNDNDKNINMNSCFSTNIYNNITLNFNSSTTNSNTNSFINNKHANIHIDIANHEEDKPNHNVTCEGTSKNISPVISQGCFSHLYSSQSLNMRLPASIQSGTNKNKGAGVFSNTGIYNSFNLNNYNNFIPGSSVPSQLNSQLNKLSPSLIFKGLECNNFDNSIYRNNNCLPLINGLYLTSQSPQISQILLKNLNQSNRSSSKAPNNTKTDTMASDLYFSNTANHEN
jgi:hypothetical protein